MERGTWGLLVRGVAKNRPWLKRLSMHSFVPAPPISMPFWHLHLPPTVYSYPDLYTSFLLTLLWLGHSFFSVWSGLWEWTKWFCKYEFQILVTCTCGRNFFESLICLCMWTGSILKILHASFSTTLDLCHHFWSTIKFCYRISIFTL